MPASLTMQNPVGTFVTSSIRGNKAKIDASGKSLSTGNKAKIDVVSKFLGTNLADKAKYLRAIADSLGYSLNALKITQATLDTASNTLSEMLTLVAQATGQSDTSRATLNSILDDKKKQVAQQIKNAVFDGRKLLTGDLGKNEALVSKYSVTSVTARSSDTKFAGNGTKAVDTLTVGAVPAADEVFYVEDVGFTAKAIGTTIDPSKNEYVVGTTAAETARNIASAIRNSSATILQHYSVQQTGATIVLTRNSSGAGLSQTGNITNVDSANVTSANTTTGVAGAVDLTRVNNMPELVGNVTASLELLSYVSAGAQAIANQYANPDAIADIAAATAAGADTLAIMKMTLAGEEFIGTLYQSVANNTDLNGRTALFKNTQTGEVITIKGSGAWAGVMSDSANATTAMTDIQTMINNTVFYQTKTLDISTDHGPVFNEGIEIANTNNTVVTLTSKDFANKEFSEFVIKTSPANAANTRFEATISGEIFRFDITTANIATTLYEGYRMDLVSTTDSNNILSINIGETGLTGLSVATYAKVAEVYKDMLMNAGAGLKVRIGEGFGDTETVKIRNLSDEQLYKDDGVYLSNLSVVDDSSAEETDSAIRYAINLVRSEQAKVSTKQETINAASNSLLESIDVTQEGSDAYLKADLVEESQIFSAAIKSINAAIAVLRSGAGIPDAAREILNTI